MKYENIYIKQTSFFQQICYDITHSIAYECKWRQFYVFTECFHRMCSWNDERLASYWLNLVCTFDTMQILFYNVANKHCVQLIFFSNESSFSVIPEKYNHSNKFIKWMHKLFLSSITPIPLLYVVFPAMSY